MQLDIKLREQLGGWHKWLFLLDRSRVETSESDSNRPAQGVEEKGRDGESGRTKHALKRRKQVDVLAQATRRGREMAAVLPSDHSHMFFFADKRVKSVVGACRRGGPEPCLIASFLSPGAAIERRPQRRTHCLKTLKLRRNLMLPCEVEWVVTAAKRTE